MVTPAVRIAGVAVPDTAMEFRPTGDGRAVVVLDPALVAEHGWPTVESEVRAAAVAWGYRSVHLVTRQGPSGALTV